MLEGIPNRRKERRKEGKPCGLTKCLLGGVSKHLQPTYISSIRQGSQLLYLQCSFLSLLFLCPLKQTLLIQLILQNILGRSKSPGHVWRGTQKWKIGFPSWWDGVNLNKWISTNLHTHPLKLPLESSKFSYQQLGNVYESDSLLQNYYISNYYLDKELSISLPGNKCVSYKLQICCLVLLKTLLKTNLSVSLKLQGVTVIRWWKRSWSFLASDLRRLTMSLIQWKVKICAFSLSSERKPQHKTSSLGLPWIGGRKGCHSVLFLG